MTSDMIDISASMPHGVGAFLFGSLPSSNDTARDLVQEGRQMPFWVMCIEQTAGRGRRGREWTGIRGNLFASLATRIECRENLAAIPFMAALALRDAIVQAGVNGASTRCKWPNDVLIDGAKVAGILIESEFEPGQAKEVRAIVGVGVNLVDAPSDIPYAATSIAGTTGKTIDQTVFLGQTAEAFKRWLAILEQDGFPAIRQAWLKVAIGLGEPVVANLAKERLQGVFKGLAEDGAFILGLDDGSEKRLYAGDVFPVSRGD